MTDSPLPTPSASAVKDWDKFIDEAMAIEAQGQRGECGLQTYDRKIAELKGRLARAIVRALAAKTPAVSATATEEIDRIRDRWMEHPSHVRRFDDIQDVRSLLQALDARTVDRIPRICPVCTVTEMQCPECVPTRTAQMEQEIARLTKEAEEFKRDMQL